MEETENIHILQAIADSAAHGILVLQSVRNSEGGIKDFSVLFCNQYLARSIGHIDYKGKLFTAIFPLARTNGLLDQCKTVMETGNSAELKYEDQKENIPRCRRFTIVKQDKMLVVNIEDLSGSNQQDPDIRARLEAAEKRNKLYDSIISNISDLVYAFDLQYRFIYANEALLAMWGKTAETAIGKGLRENGYEEWHALMHEREIDTVAATKKPIRGTVSFPHAVLGRRIYDYILSPVFNETGAVEFIAGSTRDITELKHTEDDLQRSELRLRSVIAQTPAATLVLSGDDLVIEQINSSMLQLIGQGEEIIGRPLIEVLPELEGQYVWEQVQKVYRDGISFDQAEVLVPHTRNGIMQDHYYNLAYRPRREHGHITGMIQVAIDITEQVIARKKLEESESRYRNLNETLEQLVSERTRELKRSNEDLQQFAHVASHDLKEPVRKIKTFISRLEDKLSGRLDAESDRFIDRINIATNRMFAMIDGVLTYSTANAGMQNCEMTDLNEIIKSIETDLEVTLQSTGAGICYSALPVVEGVPILLYQLFYNLINNSIKFVAPGTAPVISISSEDIQVNGIPFSRILLQDNGIGFESAYSERIFETFTRLNSKDVYEGTGLGLALCKKIAERHSGSITASAYPEQGATFTIMLPWYQKQAVI